MRQMLQLDGADLQFEGERDGTAYFQLLLRDARCEECVMPRDFLERMVLTNLSEGLPRVTAVSIDDPRVTTTT